MKVKHFIIGFLVGIVIALLMSFLIGICLDENDIIGQMMKEKGEVVRILLISGASFSAIFAVGGLLNNRRRRQEELNNAAMEYFKSHAKKEEENK